MIRSPRAVRRAITAAVLGTVVLGISGCVVAPDRGYGDGYAYPRDERRHDEDRRGDRERRRDDDRYRRFDDGRGYEHDRG